MINRLFYSWGNSSHRRRADERRSGNTRSGTTGKRGDAILVEVSRVPFPFFAESSHPLSAYLDCDWAFRFWRPSGLFYLLTLTQLTAVTGDELMPGEQTQQAVFGDYVRLRMPLLRPEVST